MSLRLTHQSQLAQIQQEFLQPVRGTTGAQRIWQEMKHGEGGRATENGHFLYIGSAKKPTEAPLVTQVCYFLTVVYLLGARTLQI